MLLSEIPIEPENQEAAHISAGLRHCVALTTQGSLHIWGVKKYVNKNQSTGNYKINENQINQIRMGYLFM